MKNQMRNTLEESIELMNSTEVSLRKLENESLFMGKILRAIGKR